MITKHLILLDIIKISILLYSGLGLSADLDLFSVNWLLSTSLELYSQALLVTLCEKVASDLWVLGRQFFFWVLQFPPALATSHNLASLWQKK